MLHPYLLTEENKLSYSFLTAQGLRYVVYFIDYSYMFVDYPDISTNIYTFNVDAVEGNADAAIADERIGITIVEILKMFFNKVKNVAVYVCDSSDDRQRARKRKFDFWFWKYSDGSIIKEDGIAVVEDVEILNALLIHKNNPHCTEIIFAFKELNEKAGQK
ncbi:MAG: DUF6169 family protein [Bacteroidota bacterium]